MKIASVPIADRLFVLKPCEDHQCPAARMACFDTEAPGRLSGRSDESVAKAGLTRQGLLTEGRACSGNVCQRRNRIDREQAFSPISDHRGALLGLFLIV
jgi:hypothetical protein